eukprot:6206180-Pleurochrysis_carterae.AAC.3
MYSEHLKGEEQDDLYLQAAYGVVHKEGDSNGKCSKVSDAVDALRWTLLESCTVDANLIGLGNSIEAT